MTKATAMVSSVVRKPVRFVMELPPSLMQARQTMPAWKSQIV